MIGVAARHEDATIASEFFELFKVAWEPAIPSKRYRVILSVNQPIDGLNSDAFLVYGSRAGCTTGDVGIEDRPNERICAASWAGSTFPLYKPVVMFDQEDGEVACDGRSLTSQCRVGAATVYRVGYDLFAETRHLLTHGQPCAWAATPTLELHIALLRHLLLELGVPLIEIPPRPRAHDFICCLTHDIDFFGIRRHLFDRTLAGFVWRASAASTIDVFRRRRPLSEALRNWLALASLPFVLVRLLPDFWQPFRDYVVADRGHPATFFLVPFKCRPGVSPDGVYGMTRAVAYEIRDIRQQARRALLDGNELAVHGIDAWQKADAARAELAELQSVTGQASHGCRMHWLYFDEGSPQRLHEAGYAYDSTWGYNDAVGYRAGTGQVFQLAGSGLMELPLTVMDSAMFFPNRMDLDRTEAVGLCRQIVENARRFGGTLVVNWHDRSLAPERLWNWSYEQLLSAVEGAGRAWFATAGDAVDWFRWRRSIRFTDTGQGGIAVEGPTPRAGLPAASILSHRPNGAANTSVEELAFHGGGAVHVPLC